MHDRSVFAQHEKVKVREKEKRKQQQHLTSLTPDGAGRGRGSVHTETRERVLRLVLQYSHSKKKSLGVREGTGEESTAYNIPYPDLQRDMEWDEIPEQKENKVLPIVVQYSHNRKMFQV